MPWNSNSPVGSTSVKNNRTTMNQNTTYIETTMGNSVVGTNTTSTRDHFWNVGSNEDGRHRFIQSPGFTVGGNAADPVIGTGMSGVIYLRTVSTNEPRKEIFYREGLSSQVYQVSPTFLTNTLANVTSSFKTIVAVPGNVYGEIFMYTTDASQQLKYATQTGFFRSNATVVNAWSYTNVTGSGDANTSYALEFGNGSNSSGMNIQVRKHDADSGYNWIWKITYRAV